MAATPESKVKQKIKRFLDAQGVYHFSPIGGPYSTQGIPDIICCVRGRFLGIEVKAPGRENNVTALQRHNIDRINGSGGQAIVASSVETIEGLFRMMGWMKNGTTKTNAGLAGPANAGGVTELHSAGVSKRVPRG